MNNLGKLGEDLACGYLVEKGFTIMGRNWKISWGELDIIAQKKFTLLNKISWILASVFRQKLFNRAGFFGRDKTIHFVEVKALAAGSAFFPEDHVDFKKQEKLRKLAQVWLAQHKFPQTFPHQIDVIAVTIGRAGEKPLIHYIPNAVEDVLK